MLISYNEIPKGQANNKTYHYYRYGLLYRKSNKAAFDEQLQSSSDKLSAVSVVVTVVIMLLVICGFLLLLYYFYYPMGKPGVYYNAF